VLLASNGEMFAVNETRFFLSQKLLFTLITFPLLLFYFYSSNFSRKYFYFYLSKKKLLVFIFTQVLICSTLNKSADYFRCIYFKIVSFGCISWFLSLLLIF